MIYNKLKTLILYGLLISFVIGCTNAEDKTETTPKRIILKEATNVNAYRMYIIEVCGKEYLVNASGGIQLLSNCN
tara:strand:- start:411 stop:635 length:225 start_codon:yes stop_codon:yes gene_type:complete